MVRVNLFGSGKRSLPVSKAGALIGPVLPGAIWWRVSGMLGPEAFVAPVDTDLASMAGSGKLLGHHVFRCLVPMIGGVNFT